MKRTELRRTGFKRPVYAPPPVAPLKPLAQPPNYAGTTSGEPVEKAVKAKPGRRAPTAEEARWMSKIVAYGCIACRMDGWLCVRDTAVHHILRGGRRIGHLFTLPLCDPGHHQNGAPFGIVSRHPFKARFEAKYGAEMDLLERLRREIS